MLLRRFAVLVHGYEFCSRQKLYLTKVFTGQCILKYTGLRYASLNQILKLLIFLQQAENEQAFNSWLKEKSSQFKKEKLLKRREEQEAHDGYYVRSREDCDKAFRQWLKHKAHEARKARAAERMKAKLHRLAARRTRKSTTLAKAIRESQSFRYVDYYGYRFQDILSLGLYGFSFITRNKTELLGC